MVHKYVQYEVTLCTMYPIKENHQNGCHLKILVTVTDLTFDVNILGALVHICTKNEVSIFRLMARRGVHRRQCWMTVMMSQKVSVSKFTETTQMPQP